MARDGRPARIGRGPRQHGAAVLMALFIAALATLIVSGLFWNQFVLMRTIENQQLVVQSRLLLRGALDWSRAILREDQRRGNVDHLDEPWAKGLAETRLDQLGETSALAARATLAGSIEDAQSRFNLRNLVVQVDGRWTVKDSELATLRRLCRVLDLPEGIADLVADHLQRAFTVPGAPAAGAVATATAPAPLALVLPDDLRAVDGVDPLHARRLHRGARPGHPGQHQHRARGSAGSGVSAHVAGRGAHAGRRARAQLLRTDRRSAADALPRRRRAGRHADCRQFELLSGPRTGDTGPRQYPTGSAGTPIGSQHADSGTVAA
jgi:hypothetical protein